jgi:hypothetical protein
MERDMKATVTFFTVLLVVGLGGCGGKKMSVGDPWDPEEAQFFDDGVDLVKDVSALSGEWAFRQKNWLEGRNQLSDFIALVDIRSVQTHQDLDGAEMKRIDVKVLEVIYGTAPDPVIFLESRENASGHELVLRYERHLKGKFILFVRWFRKKGGGGTGKEVGHHFHLSVASKSMLEEVTKRVMLRKQEEAKVVED